ncbi:MAG TPA: hypothetical protein VFZ59_13685 [Verrucomicrobiae bacterium]|nr:hypothetical protein [Verrucomicrobiae bacterium]
MANTMSANTVAGSLRFKISFLLSSILSVAVAYGSDSITNASTGKLLLKVELTDQPANEFVLLKTGDAQGSLKLESVTNSSAGNSNALVLTVSKVGDQCGVVFVRSAEVESGQWYDLTFRARTEKRENDRGYGLTISLQSRDGRQLCARTTLPEVGGEWRDYTVALHSRLSHPAVTLTITMSEPGTIWLDDITLRQRQTGREMRTP